MSIHHFDIADCINNPEPRRFSSQSILHAPEIGTVPVPEPGLFKYKYSTRTSITSESRLYLYLNQGYCTHEMSTVRGQPLNQDCTRNEYCTRSTTAPKSGLPALDLEPDANEDYLSIKLLHELGCYTRTRTVPEPDPLEKLPSTSLCAEPGKSPIEHGTAPAFPLRLCLVARVAADPDHSKIINPYSGNVYIVL